MPEGLEESELSRTPLREVDWPHAPPHRLGVMGSYFVTAATYQKLRLFHDGPRLDILQAALLAQAKEFGWQLEAWAVFSNHYHFVARPALDGVAKADVGAVIKAMHEQTATALNRMDEQPGRRVWHNFRDTRLTYDASWRARLNYTMQNPVKHGLVRVAKDYPWCSAAWFERMNTAAWVQTIYRYKTDALKIEDDFEV